MKIKIQIASRKSSLALIQTLLVISNIKQDNIETSVAGIKTLGDIELQKPLYDIAIDQKQTIEKALFTKELDNYLLNNQAQVAVHSLKDIPTKLPNTLSILENYLEEQSNDILIIKESSLNHSKYQSSKLCPKLCLKLNLKLSIASSSMRRIALLKYYFPNVQIFNIRGNVITRLDKLLADDTLDGTLLAAAGLKRIDHFFANIQKKQTQMNYLDTSLQENIYNDFKKYQSIPFDKLLFYEISENDFPPAVGQGIIGIQVNQTGKMYLNNTLTIPTKSFLKEKVLFSRSLLSKLGAGCHTPLGLHIEKTQIYTKSCYKVRYFYDSKQNKKFSDVPLFNERYFPNLKQPSVDFLINELTLYPSVQNLIFCGLRFQNNQQISKLQNIVCKYAPLIYVQNISHLNIKEIPPTNATFICSQTAVASITNLPKSKYYICIGKKTQKSLKQKFHITDSIILSTQGSFKMVTEFLKKYPKNNQSTVWIGAKDGNKEGIQLLKKQSISVTEVFPYQIKTRFLSNKEKSVFTVSDKSKKYIIFSSPSCVRSYLKNKLYSKQHILCCIGKTTAKEVILKGMFPHIVAPTSSLSSTINNILQKNKLPTKIQFTQWFPSILN